MSYEIPVTKDTWALMIEHVNGQTTDSVLVPTRQRFKYSELLAVFMSTLKFLESLGDVLELYASQADKSEGAPDDEEGLDWTKLGGFGK